MAELDGYIKKQEFYDALDGGDDVDLDELPETKAALLEMIADFFPADVRENVRGEWVRSSPMTDTLEYSCCGYNIPTEDFITPFCSDCGADMRGKHTAQIQFFELKGE